MKTKQSDEKQLAERLDAYLEGRRGAPPEIAEAACVAEILSGDAAEIRASAAFVETLSARLRAHHPAGEDRPQPQRTPALKRLLISDHKRSRLMRLTWGVTILATVVVTLLAVLLLQPRSLPADRLLAEAAEATTRRPGQVEHVVVETRLHAQNGDPGVQGYVTEEWTRIGATLDGHLTAVEQVAARYPLTGTARPLSWSYESWPRRCYLDVRDYPRVYYDAGADAQGCVAVEDAVHLALPDPLAQAAEAGPHGWIGRLRADTAGLIPHKATFDGRRVYSLVEHRDAITLTLYLDRHDYLPVGFVAETPTYRLTQTVRRYEVVAPEALPGEPFAWPPASLTGEEVQFLLRPTQP